jgi:hypothetical protein
MAYGNKLQSCVCRIDFRQINYIIATNWVRRFVLADLRAAKNQAGVQKFLSEKPKITGQLPMEQFRPNALTHIIP